MKKGTNKKITLDNLAFMVQGGFNEFRTEMNERFDKVDKRFEKVDEEFVKVREELVKIRGDINNTKDNFVPYHKFDALVTRVTNIENKGKTKVRK